MRLRSSQFVFLLLLVCSVQLREEYASHLIATGVSGRVIAAARQREAALAQPAPVAPIALHTASPAATIALDPAARAARRVAWTPRRPALEFSAISSFTGFLRA